MWCPISQSQAGKAQPLVMVFLHEVAELSHTILKVFHSPEKFPWLVIVK